jgi:2,3-bisphosphoglycerate-independent phosphoglycerate mutase
MSLLYYIRKSDKKDELTKFSISTKLGFQAKHCMVKFYTPSKPIVIFFLDGFGISPNTQDNPISLASTPNLDSFWENFASSEIESFVQKDNLLASYEALITGMYIPSIEQRVHSSITNKTFRSNPVAISTIDKAKEFGSNIHIISILDNELDLDVISELLNKSLKVGISGYKVFLHILIEDYSKFERFDLLNRLDLLTDKIGCGHIASVSGVSVLEEKRLDRFLDVLSGKNKNNYNRWESGYTQEFRLNRQLNTFTVNGKEDRFESVHEFDSVFVVNKQASLFERFIELFNLNEDFSNVELTSLTHTSIDEVQNIMFPTEILQANLQDIISSKNLSQQKIVREDFLSTFLQQNIKSPNKTIKDEKTIVMRLEYKDFFENYFNDLFMLTTQSIHQGTDLIYIHIPYLLDAIESSDIDLAINCLNIFDVGIGGLWKEIEAVGGSIIITSVMNGVEDMSENSNSVLDKYNTLPFMLLDPKLRKTKLRKGDIIDITPTLLHLLGIPKPSNMLGQSLLLSSK